MSGRASRRQWLPIVAVAVILLLACPAFLFRHTADPQETPSQEFSLAEVPAFAGEPYVAVNGNVPYFTEDAYTERSFERYAELDALGRCGEAFACVGQDLMPTEERGNIGSVKPSGWQTAKYDFVDGQYLYNRCHLIGYQLSGENANVRNLITGTRYLNVAGMLPFENLVADYVHETGNHVLYRVTPIFEGDNLVATGVLMEGYSVEDRGEGVLFAVFCYNEQPGVSICHADGTSVRSAAATATPRPGEVRRYVLNTNTKKFHLPDCVSVTEGSSANREEFTGSREELLARGYAPCGRCKP